MHARRAQEGWRVEARGKSSQIRWGGGERGIFVDSWGGGEKAVAGWAWKEVRQCRRTFYPSSFSSLLPSYPPSLPPSLPPPPPPFQPNLSSSSTSLASPL